MSKPVRQIKIFTDSEQSVMIEPNPEKDGVCIHSIEESGYEKKSFCLYATYDEALAIAAELIHFVNQNKDEKTDGCYIENPSANTFNSKNFHSEQPYEQCSFCGNENVTIVCDGVWCTECSSWESKKK